MSHRKASPDAATWNPHSRGDEKEEIVNHIILGFDSEYYRAEEMSMRYNLPLGPVQLYLNNLRSHVSAVQDAGKILRVPEEQLFEHDGSKWSDAEFLAYVRKHAMGEDNEDEFAAAFLHHLHANPHHWQHWLIPNTIPTLIEMPENFVREMAADWWGAGIAYNNDPNMQPWLNDNADKILLHPVTEERLRQVLKEAGFRWPK
ncbi:MAG: DUF5662 family protein [Anderseniella sp.]